MKAILATGLWIALAAGLQTATATFELPDWGQRLGWVLIHSIWQLALIAALAVMAGVALRRRSAQSRYLVAVGFLGLMLIAPALIWIMIVVEPERSTTVSLPSSKPVEVVAHRNAPSLPRLSAATSIDLGPAPSLAADEPNRLQPSTTSADSPSASPVPSAGLRNWFGVAQQTLAPWLAPIVALWLAGVLSFAIRPLWGLWTQSRLQRVGLSNATEEAQRLLQDLARRMKISRVVRIAQSALAPIPMVVGYVRPLILLPASVLVGMTPSQLESLLAHELAHIQRHDWIVNAIQVVVETLLFYHPAAWWLSHRIRCERELCCDDIALAVIGDTLTYGKMLLTLEELRHRSPVPSLAANGGDLVQRIERLLPHRRTRYAPHGWLAGSTVLVLLGIAFVGWLVSSPSSGDDVRQSSRPAVPAVEPKPAAVATAPPEEKPLVPLREDGKLIVSGWVVPAEEIKPQEVKLQRRVTGANFAEQVKDVPVDSSGRFSFEVTHDAAFVRLFATSSSTAPASTRFEVKRETPVEPVTLTLPPGFTTRLRLQADDGSKPVSGTATVSIRNTFEPQLGTYSVGANGEVTIPHCPGEPVQIDLLMTGFEEQRVHQALRPDQPVDVTVRPAKPARLKLVNAQGEPVAGAKVRLFSRVRADSYLYPRMEYGDGPVWATSDANGNAVLTTLCAIDPVPTNDPGHASYAFRIDAPGMFPYYVGPIQAGDQRQVTLGSELEVHGEIILDAAQPEHVTVQWRQNNIATGSAWGKEDWNYARLEGSNGKLFLHLTRLQPGRFDLFVTFTDPKTREGSFPTIFSQLEFHGNLSASSSGLKITRKTVTPGDANLTAARPSLMPFDEMPPGNLPKHVIQHLAPWAADSPITFDPPRPAPKNLLAWSTTAPVQHSMGHVSWKLFVLQDGTVFVPPSFRNDSGALHRLTQAELGELMALLQNNSVLWERTVPGQPPEQGAWRHGYELIQHVRDEKTLTFKKWDGLTDLDLDIEASHLAVTKHLNRLIEEAACGGRESLKNYRDAASKALKASVPEATLLTESDWCSASIKNDGTREISFANTTENSRVDLVHPVGGQPYVDRIEFHHQRVEVVLPKEPPAPGNANAKREPRWSAVGKVVDADGKPLQGVTVHAGTGMGTLLGGGSAKTDANGNYELHFGPGIALANDDVQLQFATISAHLPGHFEKNLSRHGDLLMGLKVPAGPLDWDKHTKDDIIVPDKPRRLDYVMLRAARLAGTLVDDNLKPLSGYSISLTGKELPPSAGVIAAMKTDEKGRFQFTEIPTGFKFQILVEPPKREPPWLAWASGPFDFQVSSGDEFFIKEQKQEVAANSFELQIKGPGVNWKQALQIGAKYQKLEPTGDYLTTVNRMHAANLRLELDPKVESK